MPSRPPGWNDADLVSSKWSLSQCFCINAHGLALQTQDQWLYTVRSLDTMVALIQAGILSSSDLREQDIEDRAKADAFAKGFTVLQTTWLK